MAELLLELLSEEIPARMQRRAAEDLQRLVTEGLKKERLDFASAETYVTPRRLVLVVDGLPERQPDLREERKGPKVGAPDKAIAGFLRSAGLESLDQCEQRDTGKGDAWFAVIEREGELTEKVLGGILVTTIFNFPWPKSMRWGIGDIHWVRPMQGWVAVFSGKPVDHSFALYSADRIPEAEADKVSYQVSAGNQTRGHRFLAPEPIAVSGFADYRDKLRDAFVLIDPAERRSAVEAKLTELAAAEGLTLKDDPGLLDEVAGLVEWPVPLLGTIDAEFMDVPAEALTSSMRAHQKYFSLLDADGTLAPRFGFVANMETADGGAAIIAGNERVLRARLADAKFFWDQDRKIPLSDRVPALESIVFHAKLGSVAQKVERIAALAPDLAKSIPGADRDAARSAALLCKADLVTGMVAEFPDLQGVMGRYYARADGENDAVANAIADHYSPQGPNDRCPTAPVSIAVAMADKLDTLIGFWLIDEKPTGSRDPFALRRAALGLIRLILENELTLNLRHILDTGRILYSNIEESTSDEDWISIREDMRFFVFDRLKFHLRDKGVRHDLIDALLGSGGIDDVLEAKLKSDALTGFLKTDDGDNLLTAYRRAANIVRIEQQKDKIDTFGLVEEHSFVAAEETDLWQTLSEIRRTQQNGNDVAAYEKRLAALAKLRGPVDRFFDEVKVNVDDDNDQNKELRRNRLCLLSEIQSCMNGIADFSQIEG